MLEIKHWGSTQISFPKAHSVYTVRTHNTTKVNQICKHALAFVKPCGTYVAQGGTPGPSGSQAWRSSIWGHSVPPPTGSCITCLLRERVPFETLGSVQVLEQLPHGPHSVTAQSLGIMQDWYVSGRLQWGHWLIQMRHDTQSQQTHTSNT